MGNIQHSNNRKDLTGKNVGSLYGKYEKVFDSKNVDFFGGDRIKAAYVARKLQQLEKLSGPAKEEVALELKQYIDDNIIGESVEFSKLLSVVKNAPPVVQGQIVLAFGTSPFTPLYIGNISRLDNPIEAFIKKLEVKTHNNRIMADAAIHLNHELDAIIGSQHSSETDTLKSTMLAQVLIDYSKQIDDDTELSPADVNAALREGILNSTFFHDLLKLIMDKTDSELEKIMTDLFKDIKEANATFEQIGEFLSELGRHVEYLRKQQENKQFRESLGNEG